MKKNQGFTILELMIAVAILAILISIAIPSYKSLILTTKQKSVLKRWESSFYLAQAQALKLKRPVILCASESGIKCENNKDKETNFNNGWIVAYSEYSAGKEILHLIQDYPPSSKSVNLGLNKPPRINFNTDGTIRAGFIGATLKAESKDGKSNSCIKILQTGRLKNQDCQLN